jgi:hypothetical protein
MMVFAIAWCVGVAYVVSLMAALHRVKRLENPQARFSLHGTVSNSFMLEAFRLLIGRRGYDPDDRRTTRLLILARTLFVIAAPLYAYVFWQVWLMR